MKMLPLRVPADVRRPAQDVFLRGLVRAGRKNHGTIDGGRPAANHHQHLAFGAELGDEVGPFVDGPDVVVLVDADRVRELEAVVALADLLDEGAVAIELEQPRRVAAVIDVGVPLRVGGDGDRFSQVLPCRKLEEVRDRGERDVRNAGDRRLLLGETGFRQSTMNAAQRGSKESFHAAERIPARAVDDQTVIESAVMKRQAWLLVTLVTVSVLVPRAQSRPPGPASAEADWLYYGGDPGGTKYSPLADINIGNVQRLQIAWQWKHWDTPPAPGFFESTPLMIDGTLYVTTPYNNVAAVDADTGQERWRFDGKAEELGPLLSASGWKTARHGVLARRGRLRMFLNSRHRLFSIDAQTGKPVPSFGNSGAVSLSEGLPRISDITHATQSSPPVIYRNLVIVGSQVPDRVQLPDPVGYVQAFDTRTGKRVWTFSVIPQSSKDPGAETWENESWRRNGHGNVWAPMALDEARGLLYLPTSTPSSDYYGGGRPGANLFAESLVCLDAATGKMKWYFQTVHHGLWDYDNPAQPQPGDDHRRRQTHRRCRAGDEAGFYVRVRSRHRRTCLANRRTSGRDRQRRARREALSDATCSVEAAGVHRPGCLTRRCEQSDP
jgi:outer membrane protein assembly factor BamB